MKDWFDIILICIVCVGLMFLATTVMAATNTINGVAPETRADGSPLDASEIAGYNLYVTYCDGTGETINIPASLPYVHSFEAPWWRCPVTYQLTAVDINELESERSELVQVLNEGKISPPSPPTGFSASVGE